ncbi:MAG: D-glycero-beta-D-manno-heptose-7-phosphate kinase [Candidatus Omnitrophica bacterium]|nr:D-glycero-beta-D-manno-heptose-7-phosphate kinase [Candidatus Omnitrophota bacterium]
MAAIRQARVLVVGDVILDQFIWGQVARISPEAPVPVVEFARESYMPGGAANVARNLTALAAGAKLFGVVGRDEAGKQTRRLLEERSVGCEGLLPVKGRITSIKSRIIAQQQQVVRVDRETRADVEPQVTRRLLERLDAQLDEADAVIVGDYGKGMVTQALLDALKERCRARGIWLSLDPKPVHPLDLRGLSLITPNRKEAFELAGITDHDRAERPLEDEALMRAARRLLENLRPALLLITLGDHGMLLCQRGQAPFLIPTMAREVFDVSGAGDTVIATFTLAIVAGASPIEAANFANHAAGIVVGKVGTAIISPEELLESFNRRP